MTSNAEATLRAVWTALGGDPHLVRAVEHGAWPAGALPCPLPVAALARTSVAACSLAAAELAAARTGGGVPAVRVEGGAVATAFTSERWLRIDGRKGAAFAPLSGFWRTRDGWVRTHGNYPHHRTRLLDAFGLPQDAGPGQLAGALAVLTAGEVAERARAAGALAVAVRAPGQVPLPAALVERDRPGGADAPVRGFAPLPAGDLLPAHGVRVLDLTRTIAGPVATRTLALLGADVLRIDSPRLPESADAHADTGFGKRSALLDLADPGGRATLDGLLDTADVVVAGYRPGALDRFGLTVPQLAARRPGLVVAQLSAWGFEGPLAGQRGFDSLVQAGCGIAAATADGDGTPGVLPAQALDHATGYLLAAAVLRSLTGQSAHGGTRAVRLSLAATARWLQEGIPAGPEPQGGPPHDPQRWLLERDTPVGRLVHARTPVSFAGGPADWSRPPTPWGSDLPVWESRG